MTDNTEHPDRTEHPDGTGNRGLTGNRGQAEPVLGPASAGWQPTPQSGEYDADATAFVQLPEGLDFSGTGDPLAAPGHDYVPPHITAPLETGTWNVHLHQDPQAFQSQFHETQPQLPQQHSQSPHAHQPFPSHGSQVHEQQVHEQQSHEQQSHEQQLREPQSHERQSHEPQAYQPHQPQPQGPSAGWPVAGHDAGATSQWNFTEAFDAAPSPAPTSPAPAPAADLAGSLGPDSGLPTGQWTMPSADEEAPDDSGEFPPAPAAPWHAPGAPATLPGGAPAPWAIPGMRPAAAPPADVPREPSAEAPVEPMPVPVPVSVSAPGSGSAEPTPAEPEAVPGAEEAPDGADVADADAVTDPVAGTDPADDGRGSEDGQEAAVAAPEPATEPDTAPADPDSTSSEVPEASAAAGAAEAPALDAPAEDTPLDSAADATVDADTDAAVQADPDAAPEPGPAAESGVAEAGAGEVGAVEAGAPAVPGTDPAAGYAPEAGIEPSYAAPHEPAHFFHNEPSEHPHASYVLRVNGADRPVTEAWIGESLLYVLRERLGLAGAKDGCSQGECGACAVQVDGRLVASCLVPAATTAGSEVRTVEGLATDGEPSDVQRALANCGAVQCGFCIPGMAMTVHDLLEGNHAPTELETRQALCGNLCRCSGYRGVLEAVRDVVTEREASAEAAATGQATDEARIPHQAPPGAGSAQHTFHHPHDGGMA
ncbi:2Fe-2S iron-sulfur cluster-binding protein [Streptomyces sp. NPDC054863]